MRVPLWRVRVYVVGSSPWCGALAQNLVNDVIDTAADDDEHRSIRRRATVHSEADAELKEASERLRSALRMDSPELSDRRGRQRRKALAQRLAERQVENLGCRETTCCCCNDPQTRNSRVQRVPHRMYTVVAVRARRRCEYCGTLSRFQPRSLACPRPRHRGSCFPLSSSRNTLSAAAVVRVAFAQESRVPGRQV